MTVAAMPTLAGAAALLRSGQLSAAELIDDVLARLVSTEPLVAAYAYVDADGARKAAATVDDERRRGTDRGPLHGIPVAVKDVFLTYDMPTRAGSRVLDAVQPYGEAAVVALLRRNGAVIVGKLVTHEFACGQDAPPTRNPWSIDCYPGGSSAGAGVAVSVGSAIAAIGTDAGGSIRKPAALTGVVGLKPTLGRISRLGVVPPSGSMDHVGVVTRTVQDAALMLQGIAGHATGDATTFDEVVPDFSDRLGRSGAGARVGVLARSVEDSDDGVRHVFDEAMQQLRKLGVDVVAVDDDALRCAGIAGAVILAAEASASHTPWLRAHRDSYGVQTRRYLEMGALIPARYLLAAYQARERIRSALREAFERQALDALASPTTPLAAMPLDKMIPSRHLERYTSNTIPANLAGLPAISVPCGFVGGLPVGLQLIGRPFAEAELLGIAAAYEREAPFAHRRPTLPI